MIKRLIATLALVFASVMSAMNADAQEAKWITADTPQANDPNTWIEFRKDFNIEKLDRKMTSVEAEIAVDSKYWLWVNDQLVVFEGGLKRGPNPTDSYYDVVELAPYLRKGENNIRLLLWYFGKEGFSHKDSRAAGMIFNAGQIGLVSDSSWESRRLSVYQSATKP